MSKRIDILRDLMVLGTRDEQLSFGALRFGCHNVR